MHQVVHRAPHSSVRKVAIPSPDRVQDGADEGLFSTNSGTQLMPPECDQAGKGYVLFGKAFCLLS